ncbi:AAA family ATPase [Geitlerinema splendidum]|nr:AAA family ATPase [Geitlerinema splendidum]
MKILPGYQITAELQNNERTLIYRGIRLADQKPVIIKTLKSEYPTLEEVTRLRHEYLLAKPLQLSGVVQTYSLEKYKNSFALILEDLGGTSFKLFSKQYSISIGEFLSIAIALAQALGELHEQQIIHKDIKPSNIIINPETQQVKITDFSLATRLLRETPQLEGRSFLEGTPAYISPEATGRMNRSIDYRSDFYSLGVTFYEMLTEQLPFQSYDPLELIHCHIAVTPIPPHQVNASIPTAVSAIVMKLLAKNAEDRYQSALGLKADLEICQSQWQTTHQIEHFTPGKLDYSSQFLIPQKLYGRTQEVAVLLQSFEKASGGCTELVLVSGYSGVGKTSTINEIHKPVVAARGYFVSGKFDQLKRNIPYAALTQAFQSLVRQILTETPEQIAIWQEKILANLGANGQIIVEVIPEIELIIGCQPTLPEVSATEAQNRFNRVFKEFIHAFTQPEHPLVLFLDDLQWADTASLKLLQMLINDPESQCLLIIGAYRDNEVNAAHSLVQTLEKIQESGTQIKNIVLQPLSRNHVSQLVNDTLSNGEQTSIEKLKPLSDLLFHKTEGNPFFLTQLLQALYEEKLLTFDFIQGEWNWNLQHIQSVEITRCDVVELMVRILQRLPENVQNALQLAACIGNQFSLDVLSIVSDRPKADTSADLWPALQAGLIVPLSETYHIPMGLNASEDRETREQLEQWIGEHSDSIPKETSTHQRQLSTVSYRFLHDRVQQAAYSLIPDSQKQYTHLKIGQLLLKNTPDEQLEDNIFTLANQFNTGIELIQDITERVELARLNLKAGKKAKLATAYDAAYRYITLGLQLLHETAWETDYDLSINLHLEALEIAYTNTQFQQAAQLSKTILSNAQNLIEKVKVYELESIFHFCQNQPQQALDVGLKALQLLGIYLPESPNKLQVLTALFYTKLQQGTRRTEDLVSGPEMTDPEKLLAMRILLAISPAAFAVRPNLYPLVTFKMVNLSLKYGNTPLSSYGYGTYGLIHCGILGDIDSGYQYGQVSLKLLERFNAQEVKAIVHIPFYVFISHWKKPIQENLQGLLEGVQAGLETGNIEYAGHCSAFYSSYLFLSGESLETTLKKQEPYVELLHKYQQEFQLYQVKIWQQLTANLQGAFKNVQVLAGQYFNEAEMLPGILNSKNGLVIFPIYLAKLLIDYWFKNYVQALESAVEAEKYQEAVASSVYIPVYNFYYSLTLLVLYPTAAPAQKKEYLDRVKTHQKQMKVWANHCPKNYQHKYDLVEAEKARVLENFELAAQLYDRAILHAREQGYKQEEALANELAAEFYLGGNSQAQNRENLGKLYLIDAYYGYLYWGATAKVEALKSRYSQLLTAVWNREIIGAHSSISSITHSTSTTSHSGSLSLDLASIMKASQAISGEIVLEKLLHKLMQLLMENAGAQKGYLFLEKEGMWLLAASGKAETEMAIALPFMPISECTDLPFAIVNYIQRTRETLVLNNATHEGLLTGDLYTIKHQPKSVLGLPVVYQGKLTAILYLENGLTPGAFTRDRTEVLSLLTTQASISLENALLYNSLEQKVSQRTQELYEKNADLEQTLLQLKHAQIQLIQNEKMSSLGQLVAGIAHEINNPVNFIYGNLIHADTYTKDLLDLMEIYQRHADPAIREIQEKVEEIDLEFVTEDLPKILNSMKIGASRIHDIVKSLRNFSRLDEAEMKAVSLAEGIDNTLLILQNRLKAKPDGFAITILKEYANLPEIECFAGALNQVFMNILANAIDALESRYEAAKARSEEFAPLIRIRTEQAENSQVAIHIWDNGGGITEEVQKHLFDPFFTTKPIGKGTGIGLSISYQIVVEKHGGQLTCDSTADEGTEFTILIPLQQESQKVLTLN